MCCCQHVYKPSVNSGLPSTTASFKPGTSPCRVAAICECTHASRAEVLHSNPGASCKGHSAWQPSNKRRPSSLCPCMILKAHLSQHMVTTHVDGEHAQCNQVGQPTPLLI